MTLFYMMRPLKLHPLAQQIQESLHVSISKALSLTSDIKQLRKIHSVLVTSGLDRTVFFSGKLISKYAQLKDPHSNVGSPVSNDRLVLRLVAGLTEGYSGLATIIQQSDPLPPFYKARSMLTLEKTRQTQQAVTTNAIDTALMSSTVSSRQTDPPSSQNPRGQNSFHRGSNNSQRGRGGRDRENGGRGRGRGATQKQQWQKPFPQQQQ